MAINPNVWRFAPSPNGYLHLGHAYSALLNFDAARRAGGRFLLRIEDIDVFRAREKFVEAIYEDLHWLGLTWDEPPLRQSQRLPLYMDAIERLKLQNLLYPCFCSRKNLMDFFRNRSDWPRDPDDAPLYPKLCENLEADLPQAQSPAWRLDAGRAIAIYGDEKRWIECGFMAENRIGRGKISDWGDAILARKDIGVSYHIAVVVDDAAQGVSEILRGADLFAATSLHRLLQQALDLPAPVYRHHRLVRDAAGAKLAKSRSSKPLRQWRAEGASPNDIRGMLGLEAPSPSSPEVAQSLHEGIGGGGQ